MTEHRTTTVADNTKKSLDNLRSGLIHLN